MTAVSIVAEQQTWLAGNPGPPISPLSVALLLTFFALAFTASAGVAWSRRRREAPLRKEIQVRPVVTYQARVDVKANFLGTMTSQRGLAYLTVRGDAFEVADPFPLTRWVFGLDYCYRSQDTNLEVVAGAWHDWIEVTGQPGTRAVQIQIGRRNMNRQIWDELIRSGAHPAGPPPQ
jgi:hypothetical protein